MPNPYLKAAEPRELLQPKVAAGTVFEDEDRQLLFRSATTENSTLYPVHRHPWGEFVCSYTGPIEVQIEGFHFVAPPQFGIWLPAGVEHNGISRAGACHGSFYIHPQLAAKLPGNAVLMQVDALTRALLDRLRNISPAEHVLGQNQRLLNVLLDQLAIAEVQPSYLPMSDDQVLGPLLAFLLEYPGDNQPARQLAARFHTSERTLVRKFDQLLGVSLREWRQRLKVVKAFELLESGWAVERIALELGYNSASAFIVMFRGQTGITPEQWRQQRE